MTEWLTADVQVWQMLLVVIGVNLLTSIVSLLITSDRVRESDVVLKAWFRQEVERLDVRLDSFRSDQHTMSSRISRLDEKIRNQHMPCWKRMMGQKLGIL
jgi:hypothetical protein